MRLIDADALIAWIKGSQQMTSKIKAIICYIKTMPTIDAVSMVQGKWLDQHENGHGFWVGVCSQCGEEKLMDNYCPNCGARMKGASDDQSIL